MAISKTTKILILLFIDICFFFLELITGYSVHSLALVADSFHMLNDVISLLVGLWAVRVANRNTESKMYTYGWQRAETLGALVNGVFLVALCLSIFLEAIQRFVEPQVVTQPMIILIVGCAGLTSNIIGLFLFHDHGHGHSHGGSHNHDELSTAEHGHAHGEVEDEDTRNISDESGNVADVLPQSVVGAWNSKPKKQSYGTIGGSDSHNLNHKHETAPGSPESYRKPSMDIRRHRSTSHPRYSSFSESSLHVHPAYLRQDVIARSSEVSAPSPIMSEGESDAELEGANTTEDQALLQETTSKDHGNGSAIRRKRINSQDLGHDRHKHRAPKKASQGHGHSHGDLNMRGVFLHVLGDALGNVGVIATALFIWLTDFSWRFYFDPAISLVITVIILCSAIPLCKAAAKILLQAAPAGLSIDDIKQDIEQLPGVISCHHIHVWQLSEKKLVASLHVMLGFDFEGTGKQEYMRLSETIRDCLREYGIENPTIQAEFCMDENHTHEADGTITPKGSTHENNSIHTGPSACVWQSGNKDQTCCPSEAR